MRNITTGKKGAKAGDDSGHSGITVLCKARHPIRIHDVLYMVIHNGFTVLKVFIYVKKNGDGARGDAKGCLNKDS